MADTPPEDGAARSDDTAKLELPSLNPFKRRRPRRAAEPAEAVDAPEHDRRGADSLPVVEPEPERSPAPIAEPTPDLELTAPPAPDTQETRPAVPVPTPAGADDTHAERPSGATADGPTDEPVAEPGQRRAARPRRSLPTLPAPLAAVLGGLVVGAFGAGLTWVSLTGCDALRGTQSCGGVGLLLILVILVLMVLFGGLVLALLRLRDARATSFLAVGVLFVVVLLTPQGALFSPWMFLVVPAVSGVAFLLAHWVTATFVEPQPEKGPAHDVR